MSQKVSLLKELLFDRENATLAELQGRVAKIAAAEQTSREELAEALQASVAAEAASRVELSRRVEGLFERTGSEERFRSSVAAVLDGALRQAEVERHDQMSRAMAPLVVKTIKTELRNSQDEMVEALYPITGRLVKAYIASAMKDLTDQINRRLSGGTNPVMLRLRSLMTGHSVADLALAEAQPLEVVELFLIRRGSGELMQHWPEGPQGAGVPSNSDIHLSGVLTAINDFAAQALKDNGGNLRTQHARMDPGGPGHPGGPGCAGASVPHQQRGTGRVHRAGRGHPDIYRRRAGCSAVDRRQHATLQSGRRSLPSLRDGAI